MALISRYGQIQRRWSRSFICLYAFKPKLVTCMSYRWALGMRQSIIVNVKHQFSKDLVTNLVGESQEIHHCLVDFSISILSSILT
jgi:hypothetical protein